MLPPARTKKLSCQLCWGPGNKVEVDPSRSWNLGTSTRTGDSRAVRETPSVTERFVMNKHAERVLVCNWEQTPAMQRMALLSTVISMEVLCKQTSHRSRGHTNPEPTKANGEHITVGTFAK